MTIRLGPFSLERAVNAVEKVRQRLLRATAALEGAGVPYAVADGNAVALWVSRVDEAAVRNTQDVDVLIRRSDLPAAKVALEGVGFVHRHAGGLELFLDGPNANARDAVHIVFAGEMVRPNEPAANPGLDESEDAEQFRVLALEALVRMKLTAFRDKDRVHVRDLIDVGLVDADWLRRLPAALAERLKGLLDTPGG
jgi:hypothetical protein